MIAVKMRNKDTRHYRRSDIGKDELTLGAFSGIKEQSFLIPAKEVGAMIAVASWLLTGTP
jgi:hypothetical protein